MDKMSVNLPENANAFYVLDISELKRRINYLKTSLSNSVELCYAVKANTFVVREMMEDINRFEICSPGEYEICLAQGIASENMVISGVYKTPAFIEALIAEERNHSIFTVESMTQFEHLHHLSQQYGKKIQVLLRLTNGSQFGINAEEIEKIISKNSEYSMLEFLGIQYFSGTQKTSAKKLKREIEKLDEFLLKLKDTYGYVAKELEYGTGFPISYFEGKQFDEKELFEEFVTLISDMKFKANVIIEVGRSLVASCGKYYTHIVDMKCNKDQNYIITDGGMNHLVYFGQYMAMNQPYMTVVGKENLEKDKLWNICGSLCSMNDIICKQVSLPPVEIGDIICFENVGAYCMTEGIALFLSRDLPAIYLLNDDKKYVCVRKPFETLHHNMPIY